MLLSQWRANAPVRDALGPRIMACIGPVLATLGVDPDPHCWVAWGDDPTQKYTIYTPTSAGLVSLLVRVNVAGEGPRASAKLIRWSRLQVGELAMETEGQHRLLSFQLDTSILRGADEQADAIGRFALVVLAGIDGRPWPPFDAPAGRRGTPRAAAKPGAKGAPSAGSKPTRRPASRASASGKPGPGGPSSRRG